MIQVYLVDIRVRTLQSEKIDTYTKNDVPFLGYVLILRFTPSLLVPFDIYKDLDLEYPHAIQAFCSLYMVAEFELYYS